MTQDKFSSHPTIVVKQNMWDMCLIHILCRDQNMLQVAETPRLWITSQQLNEHMTKRHKIKNPCITQLICICHTQSPPKTCFLFLYTESERLVSFCQSVTWQTVVTMFMWNRPILPNCCKLLGSFHLLAAQWTSCVSAKLLNFNYAENISLSTSCENQTGNWEEWLLSLSLLSPCWWKATI